MCSDKGRPEPVLFLLAARDAMRDYHSQNGRFASFWHQLEIEFAAGPYRVGDAGTRPAETDTTQWRPLRCTYQYEIVQADERRYLIRAIAPSGVAEFEIGTSDEEPVRL